MSFDNNAKNWDDDPKKVERASILAKIISKFSKGKSLTNALEFGCGTGLLSFCLKNDFSEITLADTSIGMIDVLKKKIESAKIKHLKPKLLAENEIFEDKSFDITYSLMTLHHIEDLNDIFLRFNKLLRPRGYLCIADLVKEDGDFHSKESNFNLHLGFEKELLVKKLAEFGFSYVDYQIFYSIEKTTDNNEIKKFPLFLLIVQKEK